MLRIKTDPPHRSEEGIAGVAAPTKETYSNTSVSKVLGSVNRPRSYAHPTYYHVGVHIPTGCAVYAHPLGLAIERDYSYLVELSDFSGVEWFDESHPAMWNLITHCIDNPGLIGAFSSFPGFHEHLLQVVSAGQNIIAEWDAMDRADVEAKDAIRAEVF